MLHRRPAGGVDGFINQCAAHGFYQHRHWATKARVILMSEMQISDENLTEIQTCGTIKMK
ncbi:MAG: hypothetical protein NTV22_18790 [bacterium]|nr:hypothetical protein [bacterium]